jgi:hypothetical protein
MLIITILPLLLSLVHALAPLRKHHYHMQSPIEEQDILTQDQQYNISLLYSSSNSQLCGEASLSCMSFGYTSSIPIRCGILNKAPLCKRIDSLTEKYKCDTFCDTDG